MAAARGRCEPSKRAALSYDSGEALTCRRSGARWRARGTCGPSCGGQQARRGRWPTPCARGSPRCGRARGGCPASCSPATSSRWQPRSARRAAAWGASGCWRKSLRARVGDSSRQGWPMRGTNGTCFAVPKVCDGLARARRRKRMQRAADRVRAEETCRSADSVEKPCRMRRKSLAAGISMPSMQLAYPPSTASQNPSKWCCWQRHADICLHWPRVPCP